MVERLRIMAKQRKSTQMDDDDQEAADWQGAYDWFCDESRAIYQAFAQAMSAGTAETQSGSGRQPASAVAEGHAPHPNQDTPHE